MALHELTTAKLESVPSVSFSDIKVTERKDLQRILRDQIEIIAPGVLVISEEFSDWQDSSRRIDLLGLDTDGSLVVIELKRTSDGGHMELQALRYAAMISSLKFEQVVDVYSRYLLARGIEANPHNAILEHLQVESEEEVSLLDKVRIILVAADFNKEITTTVLWLNSLDLDITCVRLIAYRLRESVLVDVQQVIPLPETSEYVVRMKEKQREIRVAVAGRSQNRDFSKFGVTCDGELLGEFNKRRAILTVVKNLITGGVTPEEIQKVIAEKRSRFIKVEGKVFNEDEFLKIAKVSAVKRDAHRWFTKDQELIYFDGYTYAFSNQWGTRTHDLMNKLISELGNGRIIIESLPEE